MNIVIVVESKASAVYDQETDAKPQGAYWALRVIPA